MLGFRDRTLYETLYSTGLRISEAIRLRVPDVDLDRRTLFIHAGKGGKDRVAPLGATACRYLAEYLRRVRLVLLRSPIRVNPCSSVVDTLFLDRLGHPFDKSGILKKLAIYATRAGISAAGGSACGGKHITVHTFRHT